MAATSIRGYVARFAAGQLPLVQMRADPALVGLVRDPHIVQWRLVAWNWSSPLAVASIAALDRLGILSPTSRSGDLFACCLVV